MRRVWRAQRFRVHVIPTGQKGGKDGGECRTNEIQVAGVTPGAGEITAGAIPTGAIPTGAIPTGAIPTGTIPTGVIPSWTMTASVGSPSDEYFLSQFLLWS
jgi:hypothetical protein